jgi:hypothetical protein
MDIKGLEQLRRKLKTLEEFQRTLERPMTKAVAEVKRATAKAPPNAGKFGAYATDKQRRWYFVNARAGNIDGADPITGRYRRTNLTRDSWATEVRRMPNGVQGVVGNNAHKGAARFVQGRGYQQKFHKASGWPVVEDVLDDKADEIQRIFNDHIRRELNK